MSTFSKLHSQIHEGDLGLCKDPRLRRSSSDTKLVAFTSDFILVSYQTKGFAVYIADWQFYPYFASDRGCLQILIWATCLQAAYPYMEDEGSDRTSHNLGEVVPQDLVYLSNFKHIDVQPLTRIFLRSLWNVH